VKLSDVEINFVKELSPSSLIKISDDYSSIFFANKDDKFIMYIKDGVKTKKQISHVDKDDIVRLVVKDLSDITNAFYYVYSKEYDKYLTIRHSLKEHFELKL